MGQDLCAFTGNSFHLPGTGGSATAAPQPCWQAGSGPCARFGGSAPLPGGPWAREGGPQSRPSTPYLPPTYTAVFNLLPSCRVERGCPLLLEKAGTSPHTPHPTPQSAAPCLSVQCGQGIVPSAGTLAWGGIRKTYEGVGPRPRAEMGMLSFPLVSSKGDFFLPGRGLGPPSAMSAPVLVALKPSPLP